MSQPLYTPPSSAAPQDDLLSRRSFLKFGLVGGAALSVTGVAGALTGCSKREEATAKGFSFLRDADIALFKALIPVILAGQFKADDSHYHVVESQVLANIDGAGSKLNKFTQGEVYKLFDLLHMRATRWLTTGIWANWAEASTADIEAFLKRWQSSSVSVFNTGYRLLTKLVAVSWYLTPDSWPAAGYPGPLKSLYDAANS